MVDTNRQLHQIFSTGAELLQAGRALDALACFETVLKSDPNNAVACLYAGAAQHELGRYEEAVSTYDRGLQAGEGIGELHNNRGNSLLALGRFAAAAESFYRAAELLTASPVPLTALATALQAVGKISEAEEACRRALQLNPVFAAAHWNLALNLLLRGKHEEGWREYEWRWDKPGFTSPRRHVEVPLWDGSSLQGKTIVLHAEQGFGDAIQFVRYAPLVVERGGRVIIECHPELVSLFSGVPGIENVVPFNSVLPLLDWQAPFMSLPRIFGTTLDTIPSQYPYLFVDAVCRSKWAASIPAEKSSLSVGLVWAGKGFPDPLRSSSLADFAPLAGIKDVQLYSLQVGSGGEQMANPPAGMALLDLTADIKNFADTAAVIEHLDMVISIDTAVAHLAGALGKPVLTLLPYAPDWRWMLDRSDSPWYPRMKLFRQKSPGDWSSVVMGVLQDLQRMVSEKKKSSGL